MSDIGSNFVSEKLRVLQKSKHRADIFIIIPPAVQWASCIMHFIFKEHSEELL